MLQFRRLAGVASIAALAAAGLFLFGPAQESRPGQETRVTAENQNWDVIAPDDVLPEISIVTEYHLNQD
ncbi:hypothetical protein AB0F18_02915 [Streptomyces sp. NPDC029216]|uniref:hypothetical protein n=1 Tax=Streptomyces sp. NPDC029216 TaxID=3154701 RepID=UPI0033EADA0E